METPSSTAPTAPLRVWLLATLVVAAVYVALPTGFATEMLRVGAAAVAGVVAIRAWFRNDEEPATAWLAVAGYAIVTAVAYFLRALRVFGDGDSFPSFVDALHVGAAVFLVVAAAAGAARASGRDGDVLGAFETATIAMALSVGVWLVVAEPALSDGGPSTPDLITALAAPLVTTLAVAIAARSLGEHVSITTSALLVAGTTAQLVADMARGAQLLGDGVGLGGLAAAVGLAAPLLVAAPAWVAPPTHHEAVEQHTVLSVGRTIALSVAVLTPITVLLALIVADLGTTTTRVVVAVAAIVAVGLSLARMWGLLDAVRRLTERRGQDRLAAMVEHSSDIVILVNERGAISYASPGLAATLGHRPADWIGRSVTDLVADESRNESTEQLATVVAAGPDATSKFETTLVRVDGQRRRMEATIVNLLGGDAVDGVVATFRDVTEQRNLERQLSHRAYHDELTGLANRALFLDRMDHALRVARPESDPVVVLFVDLDDFKSVNDALGHAVGDQLLRTIADRIRAVAGAGDTPARLGGDEFALLLEDHGGVVRAIDVAEALLDELGRPAKLSGYDLSVLASVGVAVAAPGMTTSSLLRDADIAMYEAKRAGKGQIKIFDPAMRLGATNQLELRTDLSSALALNQLRLVYQPLVSLHSGEVIGAEALLRWTHPNRGEIAPAEFIPLAERAGLINPIGAWVLRTAMAEARRWQERGERRVSINVSADQIRSGELVGQVRKALEATGLDPGLVTLEVAETVLVEQIEQQSALLNDVRDLGVKIAIDDFGTGDCSLSYLQRFPVDALKIDRRFVDEVDAAVPEASLARMILQMSSALGLTSVAEGIERPGQLQALRGFGCDLGQGYLLSRPMEVDTTRRRFGVDEAHPPHLVASGP